MPLSPSVALAARSKPPLAAAAGRKKTIDPAPGQDALPVAFDGVSDGAAGAEVSTYTTVVTETALPTLSVPVRV